MTGNLTAPILIKLTKEDAALLNDLAEKADCTPGQLARYFIRKAIHDLQEKAPVTIGG